LGLILLLTILLIVYGSLYPFHFHAGPAEPFWTLLHSWPTTIDRFEVRDIAVNTLIYLPVGFFGTLWRGKGNPRSTSPTLTILLALALSTSMELLQLFDDPREASISDVLTNVIGASLGIVLAHLYGRTMMRILVRPRMPISIRPSAALLLVFFWLAYQVYPLFPQVGLYVVRAKLAALEHDLAMPAVPAIGAVGDWLTVAQLLEVIAGPGPGLLLLPFTILLIPARLLILGRSFTWAEIAAAVCAWALWSTWLRRYRKRTVLLAWLSTALLLVRGLAPYHWASSATPFSWIPFRGFLDSNWSSAGLVLLNKSFLYGTAVWLFRTAGYSYISSTLGLAILLAIIEAVQTYLPGRSPEITDPIMIIVLAVVMKSLDSSDCIAASAAVAVNNPSPGS